MGVFDKLAPRAERPRSNRPWWTAAAAAGSIAAAVIARWFGTAEVGAGIWLALSIAAVFAGALHHAAAAHGLRRRQALAVALTTWAASALVAASSIWPGVELATTTFDEAGDAVSIEVPRRGALQVAVSGEVPGNKPAFVGYELRSGPEVIRGGFTRSATHFRVARTVRHARVERVAAVHGIELPPGRHQLTLTTLDGMLDAGLRVSVFQPLAPAWLPAILALFVFAGGCWFLATRTASDSAAIWVGNTVAFGIVAGALATPHRALVPCILAALVAPMGIVAAAAVFAAMRRLTRADAGRRSARAQPLSGSRTRNPRRAKPRPPPSR